MFHILRLFGDILLLGFFVILIRNIRKSKNCIGLSYKTQQLYLIVFCARYLDLFYRFYDQTLYLIIMKILYISASAYLIYLMRAKKPYCETYDASADKFKHWGFLIPGALVATLIMHRDWTLTDLIWSFSIWLEALAILPQLDMLTKLREMENITPNCVATLGLYRLFYMFNWIDRFFMEGYVCWTSVFGGTLQTVILGDFLYCYYFKTLSSVDDPQVQAEVGVEVEGGTKEVAPGAPYHSSDCRFAASSLVHHPHFQDPKDKELCWYLNSQLNLNIKGLSYKTQLLLLMVFCSRYLDLFYMPAYQTSYLVTMKILFISATAYTIYLMRFKKPYCQDASVDGFKYWPFLIIGALVAALFIHRHWTVTDYFWSFSIWLEAAAILPQLQIQKVDNFTAHYVALLGFYRIFYIFNWISRYNTEGSICWTSVFGGLLQTLMIARFLFNYFKDASYSNCVFGGAQVGDSNAGIEIGSSSPGKEIQTNSILATQYSSLQD